MVELCINCNKQISPKKSKHRRLCYRNCFSMYFKCIRYCFVQLFQWLDIYLSQEKCMQFKLWNYCIFNIFNSNSNSEQIKMLAIPIQFQFQLRNWNWNWSSIPILSISIGNSYVYLAMELSIFSWKQSMLRSAMLCESWYRLVSAK